MQFVTFLLTLTISLADEFNYVVEWERKMKHMPLYHQRKFANLVYSATSELDLLHMLLHETEQNNLPVQASPVTKGHHHC